MKNIFFIMVLFLVNPVMAQDHNHQNHNQHNHSEEKKSTYVCPMHPEVVMDHKGRCPECGMFLELKTSPETSTKQKDNNEETTYVCPMHPHIKNNEPSTCPICGMDLVEKENNNDAKSASLLPISKERQQQFNLKTEQVEKGTFWQYFKTFGTITENKSNVYKPTLFFNGWIKEITPKTEGDEISKGDFLFSVFSPEIIDAQNNFIQAIQSEAVINPERLLLNYGIDKDIIKKIKETKEVIYNIPFYSKTDGFISEININLGSSISKNQEIIKVIPKNSWIDIIIPDQYKNWDLLNTPFSLSYGNKNYSSSIDLIKPELDNNRLIARGKVQNFIPIGETVSVEVFGDPINNVIIIPENAILIEHDKTKVVVKNNDTFEIRNITTGETSKGKTVVYSGLNKNEIIVTSGQFLIDSQSKINRISND